MWDGDSERYPRVGWLSGEREGGWLSGEREGGWLSEEREGGWRSQTSSSIPSQGSHGAESVAQSHDSHMIVT